MSVKSSVTFNRGTNTTAQKNRRGKLLIKEVERFNGREANLVDYLKMHKE